MIIKLLKATYHKLFDLLFILKNTILSLSLKKMNPHQVGYFEFRSLLPREIKVINDINKICFSNVEISERNKLLWKLMGRKLVAVVEDLNNRKIAGFIAMYFNERDQKEKSIHVAQIAVLPEYQGLGLSKELHSFIKNYLMQTSLQDISIRISLNNIKSLNSALKTGYRPIEQYFDNGMNEERYYMKAKLERE